MIFTNVASFLGGFSQRNSVMDKRVELGINSLESRRQLGRQGHRMVLKGGHRGTKDACFQSSHQPGHFPAVRRDSATQKLITVRLFLTQHV
jgi:hypothetical protein